MGILGSVGVGGKNQYGFLCFINLCCFVQVYLQTKKIFEFY